MISLVLLTLELSVGIITPYLTPGLFHEHVAFGVVNVCSDSVFFVRQDNWQSFSDSLRSWGENVTKDLKQTLEGPNS